MSRLREHSAILLILLAGFALRLAVALTHAYTNDELSAINRLRYSTWHEFIELGVKKGDMHPAGVQVFEKAWSSLFGTSELALKFPFVFFGTLSILMIYLIGRKWFNQQTGLIAAAMLAFLFFPVLQSELARPYSPGLLIALLVVWWMSRILFEPNPRWKHSIFLGLSFAAGMYTHYYLFLVLLVVGVIGLIFLNRQNYLKYLLSALLAAVIFLPHLPVTLYHLGVGGLGWLGKPEPDFLLDFFWESMNSSWLVVLLILAFLVMSLVSGEHRRKFETRFYVLSAMIFFGTYAVGHLISLLFTPLMKAPVMLFTFPFLLLMIAYILSAIQQKKLVLILMSAVLVFSTTYEQEIFGIQFQGYRETARHMVNWEKEYGEENIYSIYNLSNPDYLNFYARQFGDSIQLDRDLVEFGDAAEIRNELMGRSENYCIVGYAERLTLPQIFETAREFYPYIVEQHHYNNSALFLLSKNEYIYHHVEEIELSQLDLTEPTENWKFDAAGIHRDSLGRHSYLLAGDRIYGPEFLVKRSAVDRRMDHYYLLVRVGAELDSGAQITATVSGTRNGELIQHHGENFWMGQDLEQMLASTQSQTAHGNAYFAFEIPDFIQADDELKISLWNRNGIPVRIHRMEIVLVKNIWN